LHACEKASALLPSLVVGALGQECQSEGVMVRDNPRSYCGKQAFKPSDIRRSLSAICGEKELARNVVSIWVGSFNSRQETAQVVVHECYRKPLKEWFYKANRMFARDGSDVAPERRTC